MKRAVYAVPTSPADSRVQFCEKDTNLVSNDAWIHSQCCKSQFCGVRQVYIGRVSSSDVSCSHVLGMARKESIPMMLKILKCLKEGTREKMNVRMPPHTSAQYLQHSESCFKPRNYLLIGRG